MIVEPDFLTHWKTQLLVDELGDKCAPLYVIALWAHCQQRKSDRFSNLAPNALKAICRYEGEASKLRSALERCGFLEVEGEAVIVHGWAETNIKLIANWQNGTKGGRKKPKSDLGSGWVNPTETQTEIGLTHTEPIDKRREEEIREEKREKRKPPTPFVPPTVGEVQAYCLERMNSVNPHQFVDFYTGKNWMVGKNKMSDWRACVRTWEQNQNGKSNPNRIDAGQRCVG